MACPLFGMSAIGRFHCSQLYKNFIGSLKSTHRISSCHKTEKILKLNPNLLVKSHKKEVFISFEDDLAAALDHSREYSF